MPRKFLKKQFSDLTSRKSDLIQLGRAWMLACGYLSSAGDSDTQPGLRTPIHSPRFCRGCFNLPQCSPLQLLSYGVCLLNCINILPNPAREIGNQACAPICKRKVGWCPKSSSRSHPRRMGKIVWLQVFELGIKHLKLSPVVSYLLKKVLL